MIREFNKELDKVSLLEEVEASSQEERLSEKDLSYEIYQNPVSKILLEEENGVIRGYLDFWITFDSSTIFKVVVKDEFRNKGIAYSLLNEAFKLCKLQEVLYMTLEVRVSNSPALKLYEKCGFEKVVVKEKYYKDGEDAIYMVKGIN